MPAFTSHAPGTPSWVDLMSPDVDASKQFYASVFGGDAEDQLDDEGNRIYVMFSQNGKAVAGLGGMPPGTEGMPPMWNTYISVADAGQTAAAVEAAGGSIMMPPMQVMSSGEMGVFADPTGAAFSVWKAQDHIGAEICNEPNTFTWNELITRDVEAAKPFYSAVFGWEYDAQDMGPMGVYNVVTGGENGGLGGMMSMPEQMPEQVPNHWMVYFAVSDIGDSISKVTAGGGQVVQEPMAAPGVGTFAIVHDPQGGNFSMMQPESQ